MRSFVIRPVLLLAVLCGYTAVSQSLPAPGGGINFAAFSKGTPTPTKGGVDVVVVVKPTTGYKCAVAEIVAIDNLTGETLGTETVNNPGGTASASFTNLGSNRQIQIAVTVTFTSGPLTDVKWFDAVVTTQ